MNDNNDGKKIYAYIAIAMIILGAVALGVSFTKLGVYALISSMIFEITAITFVNLQKKQNALKWLIYLTVTAYVIFAAALLIFAGGTIWSSQK